MPTQASPSARAVGIALGLFWAALTCAGMVLWVVDDADVSALLHQNAGNNAALGISFGLLAALLTGVRPGNPLGWLVQYLAMTNAVTVAADAWATHTAPAANGVWAGWVGSWIWAAGFVPAFSVLFAIYPDGRLPTRGRRAVVRAATVATATLCTGLALDDTAFQDALPGVHNPLTGGHLASVADALSALGALASAVVVLAALVQTLVRLRRSASPERQQLAWLVATTIPVAVTAFTGPVWLTLFCTVLSPVGLAIGVLRYRLLDIQLVLRRALVFALLTALVVAVYAGAVFILTSLVPSTVVPRVLAAAVVAVLVRPAHDLLQRAVTRLVYGDRDDPVSALTRLGDGIRESNSSLDPFEHVCVGVRKALRVQSVRIVGTDGVELGCSGTPGSIPVHEQPLTVAGEPVGTLLVSDRSRSDRLAQADLTLLTVLAGPVAVAVRAALLTGALREAHQHLVEARDAERTRLERDLHDGLGPAMSGVALGLEAAQHALADRHPEDRELRRLVDRLLLEMQRSVGEVRRIVDDLHPAGLDGVDLLTALRAHAGAVEQSSAGQLSITVVGPANLVTLPASVEVAAYRIALEAMTNVVRHSGARTCQVRVTTGPFLEIEVTDDGRGPDGPARAGVGLGSMRARADALGGKCVVEGLPPHGTRVLARLPMAQTAAPVTS